MANHGDRAFSFNPNSLPPNNPYEVLMDNASSEPGGDTSPVRRRRTLSRRQIQTRSLNPQAAAFVPATQGPSKRKASSSATAGTLTTPITQSASDGNPPTLENPVIKGRELFSGLLPKSKDRIQVKILDLAAASAARQAHLNHSSREERLRDQAEILQHLRDAGVLGLPSEPSSSESETDRRADPSPETDRLDDPSSATETSHPTKGRPGGKPRDVYLPKITSAVIVQTCAGSRHRADGATSKNDVKFLPLGSSNDDPPPSTDSSLEILPPTRRYLDQHVDNNMPKNVIWPDDRIPMEIFEIITSHLTRTEIKSMRLVNKEFEAKVSSTLFGTAIVPFNTELYDMVDEQSRSSAREHTPDYKGKGKARDDRDIRLHWNNAADDREGKVYNGHGLRVFEGFGPHIRRFGMNFEVSEDHLAHPPKKCELDHIHSYHGVYRWPTQQYARFATLLGLERTADETSRMVAALSKLSNVQELGLSIDNGLGRLSGSDRSIRNIVFDRSPTIFHDGTESLREANAQQLWLALKHSVVSIAGGNDATNLTGNGGFIMREQRLFHRGIPGGITAVSGLKDSMYRSPQSWHTVNSCALLSKAKLPGAEDTGLGVLFMTGSDFYDQEASKPVNPASLKKEQQEWLLEIGWAQRAFLESYMLAVADNAAVFNRITSLKIAKISSGLLSTLDRPQFWHALPSISDVTIMVNPDWRIVQRDSAGYVETPSESPGKAVDHFYSLLLNLISRTSSMKTLRIGYTDGGEHAQGIFGRNSNILPAPLFPQMQRLVSTPTSPVLFKNLWELTLVNCWLTPPALQRFLRAHVGFALEKVTLDSVSLTADPSIPLFVAGAGQVPPHQPAAVFGGGAHVQNQGHVQAHAALQQAAQQMQQMQNPGQNFQNGWQQNQQQWPQLANAHPQLQQMLQQMNQQMNPQINFWGAFGPAAPPVAPSQQAAPAHWTAGHRSTSWPRLIDSISPGPRLDDYREQPNAWQEPLPPRPASNLTKIVFKSCGYVKIVSNAPFDQSSLDQDLTHARLTHHMSPWFRARHAALLPQMMTSNDSVLARIHSYIRPREMNALKYAWGMKEGWEDEDLALDATYDGHMPGGTGRFSGVVEMGMALQSPAYSEL